MIRILIVDDSATIRTLLKAIFESDPEMLVVGVARAALWPKTIAARVGSVSRYA